MGYFIATDIRPDYAPDRKEDIFCGKSNENAMIRESKKKLYRHIKQSVPHGAHMEETTERKQVPLIFVKIQLFFINNIKINNLQIKTIFMFQSCIFIPNLVISYNYSQGNESGKFMWM